METANFECLDPHAGFQVFTCIPVVISATVVNTQTHRDSIWPATLQNLSEFLCRISRPAKSSLFSNGPFFYLFHSSRMRVTLELDSTLRRRTVTYSPIQGVHVRRRRLRN